jgi:xylan 1,4-beta-xylosidase
MKRIFVDLENSIGKIKPLHGVGNGPLHLYTMWDLSEYYRELAIPHVRLHDQDWPNSRVIDVPQIFRDEDADTEDPANYDFERTDNYIRALANVGAKIVWRLGVNIEHTQKKYFAHPPKDFVKWTKICLGIIRHYNHGWANGYHFAIRYWEIWNEPDLGPTWDQGCPGSYMWSGSFKQYAELYVTAATTIKGFDPSLKVGGYAAAFPGGDLVPKFLAYCRERQAPLDFFSWHTYANDPRVVAENARLVRSRLDQYGFEQTESHLNEWNLKHQSFFAKGFEAVKREHFERYKSEIGASFAASVLTLLQDASVDVANYYDTQPWSPWCGLFDMYGVPQKTFHAFKAFRIMLDYPDRVQTSVADDAAVVSQSQAQEAWAPTNLQPTGKSDTLTCLAAIDRKRKRAAILVAKYDGFKGVSRIELRGQLIADGAVAEVFILDNYRNLEPVQLHALQTRSGDLMTFEIPLGDYALVLIRLSLQ